MGSVVCELGFSENMNLESLNSTTDELSEGPKLDQPPKAKVVLSKRLGKIDVPGILRIRGSV